MVVKLKELDRAPRDGIYALAENTKSGPFPIKVGRTVNFKDRLNNYHLCFNSGFRVIALLPLKDRTPLDDRLKLTMKLEKEAGKLLGKPRTYANRTSRGSEWYFTTVSKIQTIFKTLHTTFNKGHYSLTKPPIFKFNDNFINIFNIEGVKTIPYKIKSITEEKIVLKKNVKKNMKKIGMTGYKKRT